MTPPLRPKRESYNRFHGHVGRLMSSSVRRLPGVFFILSLFERYFPFIRLYHQTWPLSGSLADYRLCASAGAYGLYVANPYEPKVCRAMEQIVRPAWTCADVGAHIGYMTLLLAQLVGDHGHVIAFEAWPENAQLVRINADLNGLSPRVTVEAQAVSNGAEEWVPLFPGRNRSNCEWTIVEQMWRRGKPVLQVPAVALDAYFLPSASLNFVKMDIEGGEGVAMVGMRRILRTVRPIVLLEFHRETGWPAIEELVAVNYRLFNLDGELFDPAIGPMGIPYQFIARPAEMNE